MGKVVVRHHRARCGQKTGGPAVAALSRFPDHIERVERVVFITFVPPRIDGDIPAQPCAELIGPVGEHLVFKAWTLV